MVSLRCDLAHDHRNHTSYLFFSSDHGQFCTVTHTAEQLVFRPASELTVPDMKRAFLPRTQQATFASKCLGTSKIGVQDRQFG